MARDHQLVSHSFSIRANNLLDAFAAREEQLIGAPGSVDAARFSFLQKACVEKDFVYLALHQVYCLGTYDPTGVRALPGYSPEHELGLVIIQELLVPNSRVTDWFLKWCVDFPYPLSELLTDREYQGHFHQMMRLLPNFAKHWATLREYVVRVAHPPLVDDMVRFLGFTSPVLLYSVYLCLSRRVPGVSPEGQLQEIFSRDVLYFQRSLAERPTNDQRYRENCQIVQMYRETIDTMTRHVTGTPMLAASAQGLPVSNQALSASAPAPTALSATQPLQYPSSYSQMHGGTQSLTNGISQPTIRSPSTVAPPRLLGQSIGHQPFVQQHGGPSQGNHSQMTSAGQSPALATTPQSMATRGIPHRYSGQHSQQLQQSQQGQPQQFEQVQQPPQLQQPSQYQQPQHSQQVRQLPHFQHVQRLQQRPGPMQAQQHPGPPTAPPFQQLQTSHVLPNHRQPPTNVQSAISTQQQQQHPRRTPLPLLPPPNVPPVISTRPNPNRLAIHQAHLRDPINNFVSVDDAGEKPTELLPYLTSFLLEPTILREPDRALKWLGLLSDRHIQHRPVCQSQGSGQRMLRTFKDGSQTYRLRCIKVPLSTTDLSEQSWCVAETSWPTAIYMHVNDQEVFARRKIHNTRDLPLDITLQLREGKNTIDFHFVLGHAEQGNFTYAVAVEVLTFRSLAPAKTLAQTLPADASLKRVCGKLARKPDDEDDELRIVSDDLKVSLVDPFTACLFNLPVRGSQCDHTECFDHETFLQTRLLKSGDQSPIEADWRCPICRRDARPQSLVVDEFLLYVRQELERTNRCNGARLLQVKADGTWEVKTDEDLPSSEQAGTAAKRKSTALENEIIQRPKLDRQLTMPQGLDKPNPSPGSSQSPAVIILD